MTSHPFTKKFVISQDDIDFLANIMIERETPMTTQELAYELIQHHLILEAEALQMRYQGAEFYNPSHRYEAGERLIFPQMNLATATVIQVRSGTNSQYGDYRVIAVEFDDKALNKGDSPREFAAELNAPHPLSVDNEAPQLFDGKPTITPEEILAANPKIVDQLEKLLQENDDLVCLATRWFPRDLMIEVDIGQLHLAEAVLDMHNGGPLTTETIIKEIGGLGEAPMPLQIFSLDYALNKDERFDEVGPAGIVMWYLKRMEPEYVRITPSQLHYQPISYQPELLSPTLRIVEAEIDDEFSDIPTKPLDIAHVRLIYPHRRMGTLPLNSQTRQIFPTAKTQRISVKVIDAQDGESYDAWVVHESRYVYGLGPFYAKHRLPIGAHITVTRGEKVGQIIINYEAKKAHKEWVRLLVPKGNQLDFETGQRMIGAEFDELLNFGVDNLSDLDQFIIQAQQQHRTLASIIKLLLPALGKLSPQGTTHVKTLYSAVNVIRRCPPGPIFAMLIANPDFEQIGDYNWKLSE